MKANCTEALLSPESVILGCVPSKTSITSSCCVEPAEINGLVDFICMGRLVLGPTFYLSRKILKRKQSLESDWVEVQTHFRNVSDKVSKYSPKANHKGVCSCKCAQCSKLCFLNAF